jgi:hypothetical protein
VDTHVVVVAESLVAAGAFASAVGKSVLYASIAEDVAASLYDGVLEVCLADLALKHILRSPVSTTQ